MHSKERLINPFYSTYEATELVSAPYASCSEHYRVRAWSKRSHVGFSHGPHPPYLDMRLIIVGRKLAAYNYVVA